MPYIFMVLSFVETRLFTRLVQANPEGDRRWLRESEISGRKSSTDFASSTGVSMAVFPMCLTWLQFERRLDCPRRDSRNYLVYPSEPFRIGNKVVGHLRVLRELY
jgi:hypothetical protein